MKIDRQQFPSLQREIDNFDIIVIGHMRCNRYFNEDPQKPPRGLPLTCTSVLVRGKDWEGNPYLLLIDPTHRPTKEDFYFDLNRRTGLLADQITHCFCTHEHVDHRFGLNYFPKAQWLASPLTIKGLHYVDDVDAGRVSEVIGEFLPGVYSLPLPGHTRSLHGVAFRYEGRRYVAAGDCVMTKYHFKDGVGEYEEDPNESLISIAWLKRIADVIVPGHDNLIIV